MCNASNRCVEYMSRSLNRPIKTQVSAGSEPPYRSNRRSKPHQCVDVQPRKRTKTLADDAACIPPAPTNAPVRAGNARLPRPPCFQARGARASASTAATTPTTSLPSWNATSRRLVAARLLVRRHRRTQSLAAASAARRPGARAGRETIAGPEAAVARACGSLATVSASF